VLPMVLRNLREYFLIEKGAEIADKLIPEYAIAEAAMAYEYEPKDELMAKAEDDFGCGKKKKKDYAMLAEYSIDEIEPIDFLEFLFDPADFAAKKGKKKGAIKKKKCVKGKVCGGSCIAKTKRCKTDPPSPAVGAAANSLLNPPKAEQPKPQQITRPKPAEKEPAKASKGGIKSYQDFADEILKVSESINESDGRLGDLVPVYKIREKIGGQVTRQEFRDWMLKAQADDLIQFMGGDMPGITYEQKRESIMVPGSDGIRFWAKVEPKGRDRLSSLPDQTPVDRGAKPIPKPKPINTAEAFKRELPRAIEEINVLYNHGGLVPIKRLKEEIEPRLPKNASFDDWLMGGLYDDVIGFVGGETPSNQYTLPNGLKREFVILPRG